MTLKLIAIGFGSFALALSGALMPGPLLTITVTDATRRGFMSGPLIITGHAILELILVVAIIFGLGPVLQLPIVIGSISLMGGVILLLMGTVMLRTSSTTAPGNDITGEIRLSNPILMGIMGSLSNPYWIIWWATIGLGYLVAAKNLGNAGIACFFAGHITADFAWYSIVSYAISRGKKIFSDRIYKSIMLTCSIILILFGCWFLVTSFSHLIR